MSTQKTSRVNICYNNITQCSGSYIDSNNGVFVSNGKATINGVDYPFNDKMEGRSISNINGKVYVDGYELVNGVWMKTLMALWYKWF